MYLARRAFDVHCSAFHMHQGQQLASQTKSWPSSFMFERTHTNREPSPISSELIVTMLVISTSGQPAAASSRPACRSSTGRGIPMAEVAAYERLVQD